MKKNVLVTGATKGIGLCITKMLIDQGYNVIGLGRSPSAELKAFLDHPRFSFNRFDLNELDEIPAMVAEVTKEHGPLYGLVNNAGIGLDGVLATQHVSDISRVLRVNLEAAIILTKYACRSMLIKRQGRVVNISSIIATTGFSGLSAYAASKAGLEGFTRSLSRELGKVSVTVNCVAPGFVETDMTVGLPDAKMDSIRRRAPLGLPAPEDIAHAVAYLLSDAAARVTGTVVTVDGGSTA